MTVSAEQRFFIKNLLLSFGQAHSHSLLSIYYTLPLAHNPNLLLAVQQKRRALLELFSFKMSAKTRKTKTNMAQVINEQMHQNGVEQMACSLPIIVSTSPIRFFKLHFCLLLIHNGVNKKYSEMQS